jgi:hypothetical protein
VDANDPRTLRWEVDQLKERVSDLENQPSAMELAQRLPWERVVVPLLLVIALKAGWISADLANSLLGR